MARRRSEDEVRAEHTEIGGECEDSKSKCEDSTEGDHACEDSDGIKIGYELSATVQRPRIFMLKPKSRVRSLGSSEHNTFVELSHEYFISEKRPDCGDYT